MSDIKQEIKYKFKDFKIIDEDNNYLYLKKENVGVVEVRIIRGSLGSFELKFVVEKFGERNKLFYSRYGVNYLITIERIKKYLKKNGSNTTKSKILL